MQVKIQQWGNSAAIRLPSAVLKQMSMASGDVLVIDVDASAQALVLKLAKTKPHYQLADLMQQCDLSAPEPAELAAWNGMQPIGREA